MVCYYKTKRGNKSLAPLLLLLMTVLSQIDCLIAELNERFYMDAVESGHSSFYQVAPYVGKRYIKLIRASVQSRSENVLTDMGRAVYMFIDKETGNIYKPASAKTPAKGIRFHIDQLVEHPALCDPYGSFLYKR